MKRQWWVGGAVAFILVGLGAWSLSRVERGEAIASSPTTSPMAKARWTSSALPPSTLPAQPATVNARDVPLVPLPPTNVDAAQSLAQAREFGEPRTPPIVHSDAEEKATPEELADPEQYHKFEERQHKRLVGAFIKATADELPRLQADIDKARAMGMSEAQIREGLEKQRRMQEVRDQLMAENPDLAH